MRHSAIGQAVMALHRKLKYITGSIVLLGLLVSPMYGDIESVEDSGAYWHIFEMYTVWDLNIRWNDTFYAFFVHYDPGPLGQAYKDCNCQTHEARILPSDGYSYFFYLDNPAPGCAYLTWAFYGKEQVLSNCAQGCDEDCREESFIDGIYYGATAVNFF